MLDYLPPHLKDFITREVAAGHYESEEQVVVVALERLAVDDDRITVAEAVAESRAAMARGETFDMADDFFQQARERASENSRRGHR